MTRANVRYILIACLATLLTAAIRRCTVILYKHMKRGPNRKRVLSTISYFSTSRQLSGPHAGKLEIFSINFAYLNGRQAYNIEMTQLEAHHLKQTIERASTRQPSHS